MGILKLALIVLIICCTIILFVGFATGDWHRGQEQIHIRRKYRKYNEWRTRLSKGRVDPRLLHKNEKYLTNMTDEEFRRHLKKLVRERFPICYDTELARYGEYLEMTKSKGYTTKSAWLNDDSSTPTLVTKIKYRE